MNILIVDDNIPTARSLAKWLRKHFRNVFCAFGYEEALEKVFCTNIPDLLIVDYYLKGDKTGLNFCQAIRKAGNPLPLLLSAASVSMDTLQQVLALKMADFVLKPFHPDKVFFRCRNLLNWAGSVRHIKANDVWVVAEGFSVDFTAATITLQGEKYTLTRTLSRLLRLFLSSPNQVISHQIIQEKLWGDSSYTLQFSNIRSHTKRLRRILGHYGVCLQNIKGQGYIFRM